MPAHLTLIFLSVVSLLSYALHSYLSARLPALLSAPAPWAASVALRAALSAPLPHARLPTRHHGGHRHLLADEPAVTAATTTTTPLADLGNAEIAGGGGATRALSECRERDLAASRLLLAAA